SPRRVYGRGYRRRRYTRGTFGVTVLFHGSPERPENNRPSIRVDQLPEDEIRLLGFRGGFGGLLERADLGERLRADHVRNGPPGATVAVRARSLTPALRLHAVLLAQQREEDLRLLLAVAGKRLQPLEHFGAVGFRT